MRLETGPGGCDHKEPDSWAWQNQENWYTGETEQELVCIEGRSLCVDISIGAFRCTRCGWTGYYTGLWRAYHEEGVPCAGSEGVPQKL